MSNLPILDPPAAAKREPLVEDDRLARAWEYLCSRVAGLDQAFPIVWLQLPHTKSDGTRVAPVAVFSIHEPNPRFEGMMQVSVTHMHARGWMSMNVLAQQQHPFQNKVEQDPLVWVLAQAAKGHRHIMSELRAMSHPVMKYDGEGKATPVARSN